MLICTASFGLLVKGTTAEQGSLSGRRSAGQPTEKELLGVSECLPSGEAAPRFAPKELCHYHTSKGFHK